MDLTYFDLVISEGGTVDISVILHLQSIFLFIGIVVTAPVSTLRLIGFASCRSKKYWPVSGLDS